MLSLGLLVSAELLDHDMLCLKKQRLVQRRRRARCMHAPDVTGSLY
jgi:hypothetical protein